jgi:hypothetical protein
MVLSSPWALEVIPLAWVVSTAAASFRDDTNCHLQP